MTGMRRRRSTHTPRKRPGTIDEAIRAATRSPVSVAPAPRTNTAVSGRARSVIWLPRREIEYAVQRRMNSGWRQSDDARMSATRFEAEHLPHAHVHDDRL